jgi:hypothetical protein
MNDSKAEIAELRQRVAELEAQNESIALVRDRHREALEVAYNLPHLRAMQDHIQEALKLGK